MYNNISKIISHIFNLIKLSKSYQNLMNIAVLLLPVLFGRCAVRGSSVGVWRSIGVYCDWWLCWSPLMSTHADNPCGVCTLVYDQTQILVAIIAYFHFLKGDISCVINFFSHVIKTYPDLFLTSFRWVWLLLFNLVVSTSTAEEFQSVLGWFQWVSAALFCTQ